MRTVTKRVEYAGVSTSLRLIKGVYLRSGSYTPRRVTEDQLLLQDTGALYFTNKRLIFCGLKKNVVVTRATILGITPMRDAIEIEKTSGRDPVFVNRDYRQSICMTAAALRFMDIDGNHGLNRRTADDRDECVDLLAASANAIETYTAFGHCQRRFNNLIISVGESDSTEDRTATKAWMERYLWELRVFIKASDQLLATTPLMPDELRNAFRLSLDSVEATEGRLAEEVSNGKITDEVLHPLLVAITALTKEWGEVLNWFSQRMDKSLGQ